MQRTLPPVALPLRLAHHGRSGQRGRLALPPHAAELRARQFVRPRQDANHDVALHASRPTSLRREALGEIPPQIAEDHLGVRQRGGGAVGLSRASQRYGV